MRLNELLKYNDIVIQCHDNPDADAISSGFALHWYLEQNGKTPRFIYRGKNQIQKSNMLIMLKELDIPVSYEPDFDEVPELLVTVDCQYGQKNVTYTEAENVAIIDHHQISVDLPELAEVRSNIGSCATVMWDLLRKEGMDANENIDLATALYYGLYTDTTRLTEISHPLDKDMRDSLIINRSLVVEMSNSNISLDELKITGKAFLEYEYHLANRYLIIHADQCDPSILGVISDFSMETADVDICIAFYVSPQEIKYSVRSCVKEVHANEVAAFIAKGIGGGGGHITKAGGSIRPELLDIKEGEDVEKWVTELMVKRTDEYFSTYQIMYAKTTTLDTSDMKLYEKLPQLLGYVKLTDVFPENTVVEIRTLEGDIEIRLDDEKYLMIGIEGEIYPITKQKLESSYSKCDEPFNKVFEYEPSIKDVFTGDKKNVLKYAKSVISSGGSRIYAKPLTQSIKLFTAWDEEKYYLGNPGDYIAVRDDDPHDIYIIKGRLFDQLYKEI